MMLPIIIALDFSSKNQAMNLLERCDPKRCRVKIGKGMFTRFGPLFVQEVMALGFDVFLDLKFHDIPNTVYDACRAAADMGVWMLNVHALGGEAMMLKAKEAVLGTNSKIIAVTILTSMNETDISALKFKLTLDEMVMSLAKLANQCKLDGVVSSCHEAQKIKSLFGSDFNIVTPGIRLKSDLIQDQKRIMTPGNAIEEGADYLVIGRSITQSLDPIAKLDEIELDISS